MNATPRAGKERRLFPLLFLRKFGGRETGTYAFDNGQNILFALPRFGGGRNDVPLARFKARRDAAHTLFDAHARELVRLRCHNSEGRLRGVQKIDHRFIVGGRVVADVGEGEHMGDIARSKKVVQQFRPAPFFALRHAREAVPRQIGKHELPEVEIIYEPRPPRFRRGARELFSVCEHVDERAFAHVGFSADGDILDKLSEDFANYDIRLIQNRPLDAQLYGCILTAAKY